MRRGAKLRAADSNVFESRRDGMTKFVAHLRVLAGALALVFVVALAAPAGAQQPR